MVVAISAEDINSFATEFLASIFPFCTEFFYLVQEK